MLWSFFDRQLGGARARGTYLAVGAGAVDGVSFIRHLDEVVGLV